MSTGDRDTRGERGTAWAGAWRLSRRGFLSVAGAAGLTVGGASSWWRRPSAAGKAPDPRPAESFTTTSRTPVVVAAHAAVLRPGGSDPQPGTQRLQVVVHASEPCSVRVEAKGATSGVSYASVWTATRQGLDHANPVNTAKVLMPEGCGAAGQPWLWSVSLAPAGTASTAPATAAVTVDPRVRSVPMRPAAGQPSSFKVATGSCSQVAHPGASVRRVPAATAMAAAGLTEFVHLGDTSYVDTWSEIDQSTSARRYTKFAWGARQHVTAPDFAALYAKCPTRVVMDDHEAGPDNCYGETVYPEARQVLSDCFAGTWFDASGFDLDAPTSVTYDHWSIGEADFFLLDNRLWRDGGTRRGGSYGGSLYASQLGKQQQKWFISRLRASRAPVKIVYCPRTFRHFYAKGEQEQLLDAITGKDGGGGTNGVVIFATGDMHAAAITRLDAKASVYEVQCAPLANSTLHTLRPLADWQSARGYQLIWLNTADGRPGQAVCNAWGEFEINTLDPTKRTVTVRLHKETGEVMKELVIAVPSDGTTTTHSPSPSSTSTSATRTTTTTTTTSPTTRSTSTSSSTTTKPTLSTSPAPTKPATTPASPSTTRPSTTGTTTPRPGT